MVEVDIVGLDGYEHLLRRTEWVVLVVQTLEDLADELGIGEVFGLVEDEPLAPHDAPLAHEEDLHRRFEIVVGNADDIEVLVAVRHHLLALVISSGTENSSKARV